jgi:hypothetical protein
MHRRAPLRRAPLWVHGVRWTAHESLSVGRLRAPGHADDAQAAANGPCPYMPAIRKHANDAKRDDEQAAVQMRSGELRPVGGGAHCGDLPQAREAASQHDGISGRHCHSCNSRRAAGFPSLCEDPARALLDLVCPRFDGVVLLDSMPLNLEGKVAWDDGGIRRSSDARCLTWSRPAGRLPRSPRRWGSVASRSTPGGAKTTSTGVLIRA